MVAWKILLFATLSPFSPELLPLLRLPCSHTAMVELWDRSCIALVDADGKSKQVQLTIGSETRRRSPYPDILGTVRRASFGLDHQAYGTPLSAWKTLALPATSRHFTLCNAPA
jgi:hypothetical protein